MSESVTLAPPERWLPVVGFEGLYDVSDLGRVYSRRRTLVLKPAPDGDGYPVVMLCNGGQRAGKVHRLVLEAFVGPCPDGMEACHGKGGRADASLANLRWDTHRANMGADRVRDGTSNRGERHGMAKLTAEMVIDMRRRVAAGETQAALARELGIRPSAVSQIVNHKLWRHC